jgi:hypothetical protein
MATDGNPPDDPADAAAAQARRLRHDMVGALELFTVYLGERLGLYRALADGGPATSAELAGRTGTAERYVRTAPAAELERFHYGWSVVWRACPRSWMTRTHRPPGR